MKGGGKGGRDASMFEKEKKNGGGRRGIAAKTRSLFADFQPWGQGRECVWTKVDNTVND